MAKEGKTGRNIGSLIFNLIFWAVIAVLFVTWITDYVMVKQEKNPKFCIQEKEFDCDGGTVKQCNGLGYKVYTYSCSDLNAIEFGPFFIKSQK